MRRSITFAVVLAVYLVVGKLGLHFASVHPSATPLWPPTGIALAALLLFGFGLWPAIFLAAFIVNVTTAGSVLTGLGIAAGNTLEALVGAFLVARFANGPAAFKQPRTIFAFCAVAGFAATAISATVGVASLALTGYAGPATWGPIWLTWWLGDAAGALVVAPLLIVWASEPRVPLRGRVLEAAGVAIAIAAAAAVAFSAIGDGTGQQRPIAFLCLPPLVWAAYRFGPRGAVTAIALLCGIATAATVRGLGSAAADTRNESLLIVQLFLLTTSATVLPLAALAQELARRAERSAENARLFAESEERRRTAEAFFATSRALALSLDMREVADRIVTLVRELLGGTVAIVYRIDAASGNYEALAVAGDPGPAFVGPFTIPAGVGTIGLAVHEGRAVATTDLTVDNRIVLTDEVRERLQRAPHRAVLAVPLVSEAATIGAFLVGDHAGRRFTDDERVVAEAFAHHAAVAIANARRFEEVRHAERQMATLSEITQSITSSLDLDTVLQRIAQGAQELCASDTAAIFLRDGDSADMVPRYRVGPAVQAYEGLRIRPGQGLGGHVVVTGRALRSRDYIRDPRVPDAFHAIAQETGTVTLMVVPITIRDRVEGLLYISNRTARSFTEQDERVCMRLAGQAAAAIQNARLFAEAQAARAEAEAASGAKDDFLAVLSHELRTPLNAIVGWTRMLRTGTMAPDAVDKAIEVIDRNAAAQVQLVEDLLDVSRIVAGTLKLDLRPVKLTPVLAAALDAVRPTAERKGIRFVSRIAPAVDGVDADAGRLQQAIWNLLVNAVKFTPSGGVVELCATATGDTVEITVSDSGVGIDAAMLPHVFERFRQADSSTTRQHGGLGLGLAIVKRIVELHGGTVSVTSEGPGLGATFTVRLRHTPSPSALASGSRPPLSGTRRVRLSGVSVLVVDDDADARDLCSRALGFYGASLTVADSVAAALEALHAVKPDVIVADIGMPGQDGFDLIRRLRADESGRGRRTWVIALTAYVSVHDRLRILDAGFDAHISKPFDPAELATTVHEFVRPR